MILVGKSNHVLAACFEPGQPLLSGLARGVDLLPRLDLLHDSTHAVGHLVVAGSSDHDVNGNAGGIVALHDVGGVEGRPVPLIAVHVTGEENVHVVLFEQRLHRRLHLGVHTAAIVHGVVPPRDDPGSHRPALCRLLQVLLEPRNLIAEASTLHNVTSLLGSAGEACLQVQRDEVHRSMVETVPHVHDSSGLLAGHAEAAVVGREVAELVPLRRAQHAVGAVAVSLVVPRHRHPRKAGNDRLHGIHELVPGVLVAEAGVAAEVEEGVVGVPHVTHVVDQVDLLILGQLSEVLSGAVAVDHAQISKHREVDAVFLRRRTSKRQDLRDIVSVNNLIVVLSRGLKRLKYGVVVVRLPVRAAGCGGCARERIG
mmetsp:Transcript_19473/g.36214  ORF Transcript_19473/g.36214 Transcript_19473/m.36214 type:complete len:369 (-) Transcript_19473:170-1276(-)